MLGSVAHVTLPGLLLVLSSCASPRERYYLLEQSAPEESSAIGKNATVVVGPVVIPAEIDRPQIVVRKGRDEVAFNEQERWAVSLKEALPRMLAGELSRTDKSTRFVTLESSMCSTPKARLAIDITRFEVSYETGATVALHWVYWSSATNVPALEGEAFANSPLASRGIPGLLRALQSAVAKAAETVGKRLHDDS